MKYQKEVSKIDELVSICEVIPNPFPDEGQPRRSFGMGSSNISFVGFEKLEVFQGHLEHLYTLNKELSETWTLKKFETELASLIRRLKIESKKCEIKDIEELFASFLTPEIYESEILYELYGAELHEPKLSLGDFTVYNFDLSISELTKKYPYLAQSDIYFSHRKSQLLLGIHTKARENAKAVEIADKLVETFENVFSYMICDLKHERSVGVFNFRGWQTTSAVVCNNKSIGYHGRSRIFIPVDITDPFFLKPSQGNDKLWKLITKSNKTEIEKRILTAVEWIGKAVYDLDISKSLVQFVFAIEGMLQFDEKTFVTPSIVSQLSDSLAFIIQDDPKKRKSIAKYFKDIYQKRSAIAHGASKTIDNEDLHLALEIAKLMVISFLTTKPFDQMKSMDDLSKHLIDLKFK
jgi:hypothetical protein